MGQPPDVKAVSQGMLVGIAIGTLFIPLLGIIMGLIFMMDANEEKKKAGKIWLGCGIGVILLYCACGGAIGFLGALSEA